MLLEKQLKMGVPVDENYRIVSYLGQGGMCIVYRAQHTKLEREVALKFIKNMSPETFARFKREAVTLASLNHKNIVRSYELGTYENIPFIALEYIAGETLAALLNKRAEHRFTAQEALPILGQICDALGHAHANGVIHRDIKPSNIMIVGDQVKVVDFGISKLNALSGKEIQALTQTGEVIGSLPYMSPEQCAGMTLDARSDIYSFGCLMYEMLAGKPPFDAENPLQMLSKHVDGQITVDRLLDNDLGAVVLSCLEKRPADRPQSAAELKSLLLNPPRAARRARLQIKWKTLVKPLAIFTGCAIAAVGTSIVILRMPDVTNTISLWSRPLPHFNSWNMAFDQAEIFRRERNYADAVRCFEATMAMAPSKYIRDSMKAQAARTLLEARTIDDLKRATVLDKEVLAVPAGTVSEEDYRRAVQQALSHRALGTAQDDWHRLQAIGIAIQDLPEILHLQDKDQDAFNCGKAYWLYLDKVATGDKEKSCAAQSLGFTSTTLRNYLEAAHWYEQEAKYSQDQNYKTEGTLYAGLSYVEVLKDKSIVGQERAKYVALARTWLQRMVQIDMGFRFQPLIVDRIQAAEAALAELDKSEGTATDKVRP